MNYMNKLLFSFLQLTALSLLLNCEVPVNPNNEKPQPPDLPELLEDGKEFSVTNKNNSGEPAIVAGSTFWINGSPYFYEKQTKINFEGIKTDNLYYVYAVPSSTQTRLSFICSLASPSYNAEKQGYYNGADLAVAKFYYTSGMFNGKVVLDEKGSLSAVNKIQKIPAEGGTFIERKTNKMTKSQVYLKPGAYRVVLRGGTGGKGGDGGTGGTHAIPGHNTPDGWEPGETYYGKGGSGGGNGATLTTYPAFCFEGEFVSVSIGANGKAGDNGARGYDSHDYNRGSHGGTGGKGGDGQESVLSVPDYPDFITAGGSGGAGGAGGQYGGGKYSPSANPPAAKSQAAAGSTLPDGSAGGLFEIYRLW